MAAEIAGAIFVLWLWLIQKQPEKFCPYCKDESKDQNGKSDI